MISWYLPIMNYLQYRFSIEIFFFHILLVYWLIDLYRLFIYTKIKHYFNRMQSDCNNFLFAHRRNQSTVLLNWYLMNSILCLIDLLILIISHFSLIDCDKSMHINRFPIKLKTITDDFDLKKPMENIVKIVGIFRLRRWWKCGNRTERICTSVIRCRNSMMMRNEE